MASISKRAQVRQLAIEWFERTPEVRKMIADGITWRDKQGGSQFPWPSTPAP
jgi:hypothetical protein